MKLENQVTSLEPSKKLEELGVEQGSLFYWQQEDEYLCPRTYECWFMGHTGGCKSKIVWVLKRGTHVKNSYNAYTITELGEVLEKAKRPDVLEAYIKVMDLTFEQVRHDPVLMAHNLMTQPDIPAQMIIHLLENNLLTPQ